MAKPGDVLENPVTGERVEFRKTDADALEYETTFVPRGFAAQPHLHPSQEEHHEVLEGEVKLVVGGTERTLKPGTVEIVPPRTPHKLVATSDRPIRMRFESRPALRTAELLERLFGLANEGKANKKGMPGLLDLAVIGREFEPEGYATRPPLAVQRALLGPLAALGRGQGEYDFVDEWDVDAPQEAVFDAIADAHTYPQWWKPVYISVEAEGEPRVGQTSAQLFKGRLPYKLRTRSTIMALDRPNRVEADVEGDLRGKGIWTLTRRDGKTHVRFDWTVFADRALLRRLTPVLRPLFRSNHNWAIERAKEGLEPYARSRAPG